MNHKTSRFVLIFIFNALQCKSYMNFEFKQQYQFIRLVEPKLMETNFAIYVNSCAWDSYRTDWTNTIKSVNALECKSYWYTQPNIHKWIYRWKFPIHIHAMHSNIRFYGLRLLFPLSNYSISFHTGSSQFCEKNEYSPHYLCRVNEQLSMNVYEKQEI